MLFCPNLTLAALAATASLNANSRDAAIVHVVDFPAAPAARHADQNRRGKLIEIVIVTTTQTNPPPQTTLSGICTPSILSC